MTLADWILLILLAAGMLGIGRFIYRYHRYSPWRLSQLGRILMGQKIAIFSLLALSMAARLFGGWPLRTEITLLAFAALVFFFWRVERDLVKTQTAKPYRDNWAYYWNRRRAVRDRRQSDDETLELESEESQT